MIAQETTLSRTNAFVRRHALIIFFALAFAISWSFPAYFPVGPFAAAILMTAATGEWRDFLLRITRWRVGLRWYAAALLVPAAIGLAAVGLNVLLGAPVPSAAQLGPWYNLFLFFAIALVDAPLFEDTGWRGFAMPRFSDRRSPLANTLILGVLLAAWHFPRAIAEPGVAAPYLIATFFSAIVTNWVYYNTRESALMAILYHSAANTVGLFFAPLLSGPDLVRYFWLLATANAVAALIVVLVTGPSLRRKPAPAAGRNPSEP